MQLSPSRESATCAATQEFSNILWNPKVHYRVHNSPPLVPILNQISPVHTTPSYLSKFLFNIVTDLFNALPGNSSVNTLQRATMEAMPK
jgi:hypothetical protein